MLWLLKYLKATVIFNLINIFRKSTIMFHGLKQAWGYASRTNNTFNSIFSPTNPDNIWMQSAAMFEKAGAVSYALGVSATSTVVGAEVGAGAYTASGIFFGLAWGTRFVGSGKLTQFYNAATNYPKTYVCKSAFKEVYSRGGSYSDAYKMAKNTYLGFFSTLSESEFFSILESNGLVDSYARTHPDAKINSANGYRGEIGGVAVEVGQIKLFNKLPAQSLFDELVLCLPFRPGTQQLPFTQAQLRQVMVELTNIILVEQTNPFFSLHFSKEGKLYPIIHPAYHNTLVGDVIGMLDYYMKGYLNGGFYSDAFIRQWHKTENMDRAHLTNNVFDLKKYAKQNNIDYVSLRELMYLYGLQNAHSGNEDEAKTNFRTSFRIIASQADIQSRDNVLVGSPNARVEYSIELMPHYKQYLADFQAQHGYLPDEYQKLQQVYSRMSEQIKTNMAKLPFCQGYFHLLDIISFFSYVVHSLKSRGQIPSLTRKFEQQEYIFPTSLPPYPVRHYKFFPVKILMGDFINALGDANVKTINELIQHIYEKATSTVWEQLGLLLKPAINQLLSKQIPPEFMNDEIEIMMLNELLRLFKKSIAFSKRSNKIMLLVLDRIVSVGVDINQISKEEITSIINSVVSPDFEEDAMNVSIKEKVDRFLKGLGNILALNEQNSNFLAELQKNGLGELADDIKKLKETNRHLLEIFKREELDKQKHFFDYLDKNQPIFDNSNLHVSVLDIADENFIKSEGEDKKIIGGCGVDLTSVDLLPLNVDENSYQNIVTSAITSDTETAEVLKINHEPHYLFKLKLADHLSNDPYEYRQNLPSLISPTVAETEERSVSELILDQPVTQPITSRPLDAAKRTILHYGSLYANQPAMDKLFTSQTIQSFWTFDAYGYSPFHSAVLAGNLAAVKKMLSVVPALANQQTTKRYTPLMLACLEGNIEIVSELLKIGADPNICLMDGSSALYMAVQKNHDEVAMKILMESKNVNINLALVHGQTILHEAIEIKMDEVVNKLIELGANLVAKRDQDGFTPFHTAAYCGRNNYLKIFITRQQLVGLENFINQTIDSGETALHLAVKQGAYSAVQILLGYKANVNLADKQKNIPLFIAIKQGFVALAELLLPATNVNLKDRQNKSALILAAEIGAFELCDAIVDAGFNLKTSELERNSFMPYSYYLIIRGEYLRYKKYLNAKLMSPTKKYADMSAACLAAYYKQDKIYYFLTSALNNMASVSYEKSSIVSSSIVKPKIELPKIENSSLPQSITSQPKQSSYENSIYSNLTAVHYAIMIDDLQRFKSEFSQHKQLDRFILIENKPHTLLHLAVKFASIRCLGYLVGLIDKNKVVEINKYENILVTAVKTQNLEITDLVLRIIKNINDAVDKEGNTIQHVAVKTGSFDMVEHLFTRGARTDAVNKIRLTPWHIAVEADDDEMLKLLERLQPDKYVPATIFAFTIEKKAKKCTSYLNRSLKKTLLSEEIANLFEVAIEKQDLLLLTEIESYGYQGTQVNNLKLIEMAIKKNSIVFFDKIYTYFSNIVSMLEVLRLIIKHESFIILEYLHENNLLSNEVVDSILKQSNDLNKYLKYALLNKYDLITSRQKALVETLDLNDVEDFEKLLRGYPVNNLFFMHNGVKIPLLHLVVGKNLIQFLPVLKKYDANPLLLDSKGLGLIVKSISNERYFIKKLTAIYKIFPKEFPGILNQTINNNISVIDLIGSYQFKQQLPVLVANHLSAKLTDSENRNLIHKAAQYNNFDLLEVGIKAKLSVNSVDRKGVTPLMIAASHGHVEFIQRLLFLGADPNQVDIEQRLPLHYAVLDNKFLAALVLLPITKNVSQKDRSNQTVLMMAVMKNCSELIPHLINYRSDISSRDRSGYSALHYAAMLEHIPILLLLISMGHPVDLKQQCQDDNSKNQGLTPLHVAVGNKKIKSILALLNAGASVTQHSESGKNFFDYAVLVNDSMVNNIILNAIEAQDTARQAKLLFTVAASNNLSLLHSLLLAGHKIDITDQKGKTPLIIAVQHKQYSMVAAMLEAGANPEIANINGEKVIHYAASLGEISVVRELAKKTYSVDFNAKNYNGDTPLHLAAMQGNLGCIIELVRLGKINNYLAINHKNYTAIESALLNDHWEIAELLMLQLQFKDILDLTKRSSFTNIPLVQLNQPRLKKVLTAFENNEKTMKSRLAIAIELENLNAIRLMLKIEKDLLDKTDNQGNNFAHYAVSKEAISPLVLIGQMREELLTKKNNAEKTPADFALSTRNLKIFNYFKKLGLVSGQSAPIPAPTKSEAKFPPLFLVGTSVTKRPLHSANKTALVQPEQQQKPAATSSSTVSSETVASTNKTEASKLSIPMAGNAVSIKGLAEPKIQEQVLATPTSNEKSFQPDINQPKSKISVGKYSEVKIKTLLNHYLGKIPSVEVFDAYNNTSEGILKNMLRQARDGNKEFYVIPIDFLGHETQTMDGHNSWAILVLKFGKDRTCPNIFYRTSLGSGVPYEIKTLVSDVFAGEPIIDSTVSVRDSNAGGAWAVEFARHLVTANSLPTDIVLAIRQHQQVLTGAKPDALPYESKKNVRFATNLQDTGRKPMGEHNAPQQQFASTTNQPRPILKPTTQQRPVANLPSRIPGDKSSSTSSVAEKIKAFTTQPSHIPEQVQSTKQPAVGKPHVLDNSKDILSTANPVLNSVATKAETVSPSIGKQIASPLSSTGASTDKTPSASGRKVVVMSQQQEQKATVTVKGKVLISSSGAAKMQTPPELTKASEAAMRLISDVASASTTSSTVATSANKATPVESKLRDRASAAPNASANRSTIFQNFPAAISLSTSADSTSSVAEKTKAFSSHGSHTPGQTQGTKQSATRRYPNFVSANTSSSSSSSHIDILEPANSKAPTREGVDPERKNVAELRKLFNK